MVGEGRKNGEGRRRPENVGEGRGRSEKVGKMIRSEKAGERWRRSMVVAMVMMVMTMAPKTLLFCLRT